MPEHKLADGQPSELAGTKLSSRGRADGVDLSRTRSRWDVANACHC